MKLISLLPFMDEEELKELAQKIINKEITGVRLAILFPFLSSHYLEELVDELIKTNSTKELYQALPFLSKESVQKIYDSVKKGELKGFKEHALIPFLGKSAIKDLFNTLVKEAMENPSTDTDEDLGDLFDDDDDDEDEDDDK